MFDQLQLAYVVLDGAGRITQVNDYFVQLSGYARTELLGNLYHRVVTAPAQQTERQSYLQSVLAGESPCNPYYELEIATKTGDTVAIQWQSALTYDARGHITGLWAVGHTLGGTKPGVVSR